MKLLHLGSPGNQFRPFEQTRIIERAVFDQNLARGAHRACRELDSASLAEMSGGRPRAIFLIEGSRAALCELETQSVNHHEEIACATRDHLTGQAVAKPSHKRRAFGLVADIATVAAAGEFRF